MQYAHHANVSKMTFKCHCQLNLSVMVLFLAKNKLLMLFFKGDPEAVSLPPAISCSFHPAKICSSREKQQHMLFNSDLSTTLFAKANTLETCFD